jgi:hypothetical protein
MRKSHFSGASSAWLLSSLALFSLVAVACGDDSPDGPSGGSGQAGTAGATSSGGGSSGAGGNGGGAAGTGGSSNAGSGGASGAGSGGSQGALTCERRPPLGACDDPAFGYCIEDPNVVPSCVQGTTKTASCSLDKLIGTCVYAAGYVYYFYEGGDSLETSKKFCETGGGLFCSP